MKKKITSLLIGNLIILICIFCSGCLSVKYQPRTKYMLSAPTQKKARTSPSTKILEINSTTISPQFSDTSFVYRVDHIHYLNDYYNIFFIPPSQQINLIITQHLRNCGLFKYIDSTSDIIDSNYILQPQVLDLYADYRNANNPKAIITIQFTLFKPVKNKPYIVLNKIFKAAIPLKTKDSKSLVEAWNIGLNKILRQLTQQLRYRIR